MPDKIDQATASLRDFVAGKDPAGIERAVDTLEEFDFWSLPPAERLPGRQRLLSAWCLVLVGIDRVHPSGLDPESGMPNSRPPSPASPEVIASYERHVARHRLQLLLLELDERSVRAAHRAVEKLFSTSKADRKEIVAIFQKARLSPARREQIIAGPPPPAAPFLPDPEEAGTDD